MEENKTRRRAKTEAKEKQETKRIIKQAKQLKQPKQMKQIKKIKEKPSDEKKVKEKKQGEKVKFSKKSLTICIVIGIVALCWILIANYTTFGLVLNKSITDVDAVKFGLESSNNQVLAYQNEILLYESGKLTTYDRFGKETWKAKIEGTLTADVATSGGYIQVINKDQGLVYVYKNKYESARIKIDGKILSGNINKQGMSVIEYSSSNSKTMLGVYDNGGVNKYNVKLSTNIVGEYILSDNSRYLAYVDVNISGISASSNINVIDLSRVSDENYKVDTIYTKDNSLAYKINWNRNELICRLNDEIVRYNVSSKAKEITDISLENMLEIDTDSTKYAYTTFNETKEGYSIKIKTLGRNKPTEIEIQDSPKYFCYENGNIFVSYQKEIQVYNNFGMKIKDYKSDSVITKPVIFNNGKSVAIVASSNVTIFTI